MIYLHTALAAEARPLIDHYRLRASHGDAPFRLYGGEDVLLVVSGVGKAAAAAAVAHAQARAQTAPGPWLNIGIAGHSQAPIGTLFIAHKIVDVSGDRAHYPTLGFSPPCDSTCVRTVDAPSAEYDSAGEESAFDMEASAFFATAQRFIPTELAHSLKVVSDNPQSSWRDIDRQKVRTLIGQHLHSVDALRAQLETLSSDWHDKRQQPPFYQSSIERWRFSSAQQNRLRHLLRQWHALRPNDMPWDKEAADIARADQALAFLEMRLGDPDSAPY